VRTGNQSDFYFFNPSQNPEIVQKKEKRYGENKYRINPPIEIPLNKLNQEDTHVDELKRYIERLIKKSGKREFGLDDESAKNLFDYLSVLYSTAKIEQKVKDILKIYNQLRQKDDVQFPIEINKKIRLLQKVRKQLLMINYEAQKRKKNRSRMI